MATWIKAECSEKDGDANCSNCGHWDWSDYNYCSNCGEYMKEETEQIQGNCKICEYMREERYDYPDKSVLIPHCWGQKDMPKVLYTDTCKYFKKKVER